MPYTSPIAHISKEIVKMKYNRFIISLHDKFIISVLGFGALLVFLGMGIEVTAQEERQTFPKEAVERAKEGYEQTPKEAPKRAATRATVAGLRCTAPVTRKFDVGDERVRFTPAVYGTTPGGGEGGQFDKTPVLTTRVTLRDGTCLDAHVSAIIGSKLTYGVSRMALFQVTLTRVGRPAFGPRHMVGHYETPFGRPSPAVALEAERDVDMYASNFFQRVGRGRHEVPPGTYRVDVWWAGGPDPGGAIGAAFVLTLYFR